MDLPTPVLLILRGVLLVHVLPDVASAKISFTAGVISVYGVSLIVRFVDRGKTGTSPMVQTLYNFWSKTLFLVWVNVSGPLLVWVYVSESLVRLPCASLAVALFNLYPVSFIFKLLISLTIFSNLSSFSLVKIVSAFYLCELDEWPNSLAVKLLAYVIDLSSSSIMTFMITYWIFALNKGVLLLSLKVVMVSLSSI